MTHSFKFGLIALAAAVLPAPAMAAVVVVNSTQLDNGYAVASNDLLNLATVTASYGNFQEEGAIGLSTLNDGLFGTQGNQCCGRLAATAGGNFWGRTIPSGQYVEFTFPTAQKIFQINTYSGWDYYRGGQSYVLSYATAAAPATWITLASEYNDAQEGGDVNTRAMIYDTGGGAIASNVIALRWDFGGDLTYEYAGYREFDVFGGVPEPATWSLMITGFGLVGAAMRRRKALTA